MNHRRIFVKILILLAAAICNINAYSQETITYKSKDGAIITADLYDTDKDTVKYMLMFHQAEYSRGEFKETAKKLIKLGFTCIAVDLRSGNESNFVANETAKYVKANNMPNSMTDAEQDIIASIEYVKSIAPQAPISIFGSSYSASLCLKVAKERNDITCVIAFSPGEYFEPNFNVQKTITGMSTPVFAACTKSEAPYMKELLSGIGNNYKTIFVPDRGEGLHGSKTLWWESSTRDEYWLALLFFLKKY